MPAFDPIDSWFEGGFRIRKTKSAKAPAQARHDAVRARVGSTPKRGGATPASSSKTANIKAVVRKAPEVMVKITGSSSGMGGAKRHLDYISRNGEIDVIDGEGNTLQGTKDLWAFRKQLEASGIPEDSKKREFLHVMFSMPAGTNEKGLSKAVANFCKDEFSNRQYTMATHMDKKHIHVHLLVCTRDMDRAIEARLSPRKNDLFRWRCGFADNLREEGIDAAASPRQVRSQYRKPEHAALNQIRQPRTKLDTSASPPIDRPINARISKVQSAILTQHSAAVAAGSRPVNPAQSNIKSTSASVKRAWEAVQINLHNEGDTSAAAAVTSLIQATDKTHSSRDQLLYDAATEKHVTKKPVIDDGHSL